SESLVAFAAKNVFVCGIGIAQIGRINRAVGIEDFSETQANSAARGSFHFQSYPTHHVLPHIKDIGSVWQVRDLLGPDSRDHPDGFGDLTGHGDFRCVRQRRWFPRGIVELRLLPAGLLQPRIVDFSAVEIWSANRRRGSFPGTVAENGIM